MEKFTPEDASYGLRNLFVGDEEETRIIEISDQYDFGSAEIDNEIRELVERDRFESAYRVAIRHAFEFMTKAERDAVITEWADEWNKEYLEAMADEDDGDIDDEAPAADLIALADEIMAKKAE